MYEEGVPLQGGIHRTFEHTGAIGMDHFPGFPLLQTWDRWIVCSWHYSLFDLWCAQLCPHGDPPAYDSAQLNVKLQSLEFELPLLYLAHAHDLLLLQFQILFAFGVLLMHEAKV